MDTTEATLGVMVPVDIDDTTLISTTVVENDYPVWDSSTFNLGDRVISPITHRIYESAADNNTNNDPTDINNRVETSGGGKWWIDVSATNAWKMFDGESGSRTVGASPITIVLAPGFINGLYVGGIKNCDTATITMKDSPNGSEVYSKSIQLENSLAPDYWEYCFGNFKQQFDFVLNDLPPHLNCELTMTLEVSDGNIEVGMMQSGDLRPIGITQTDASVIPKTYSTIKIDDFGHNKIKRRKSAKDIKLNVYTEVDYADTAIDILTELQDKPSVWIATTLKKYQSLRVFGLGNGELRYTTSEHAFIDLDIKGLI